jgi:FAD/FMN-containing dehydrogenase
VNGAEKQITHQKKVNAIASQVKAVAAAAQGGDHFSLKKSSVSHMVPKPDNPEHWDKKINISELTEIVEIDTKNRICIAESGVTFSTLVNETLKYDLAPMTVSELKEITIGGAVSGCSVESMSYKYGGFHDSCLSYEIISGTGEIINCSKSDNADLFDMVHGSFGTLGIITLLKFNLIPAKPFVRLDYVRFSSFNEFMSEIRVHYEKRDIDFMDAIIHSPREFILCIGTFVDEAPYSNKYFYNVFYKSTSRRKEDFLRTYDYFFRYDADCHWSVRSYGLEIKPLRLLFGRFLLGSSNILKTSMRFPFLVKKNKPDVFVDVFIPFKNSKEFYEWYLEVFNYFPLWIVPYRIDTIYPWINPELVAGIDDPLFIDFAIYGFRQKGELNYYKALEEKVFELKGMKTLITHNYYEEEMFWKSFNRERYDTVKYMIDPKNLFRNLYNKTNYEIRSGTSPVGKA